MKRTTMKGFPLKPLLFGLFGFSFTFSTCVSAEPLVLSNVPLQATGKAEPNLMILLDSSGSMGSKLGSGETRLEVAKDAAINVVNGLNDIRVGLARFNRSGVTNTLNDSKNDDDGAFILKGLTSLSTAGARKELVDEINGISASGYTPLAESLASIGRYYVQGKEAAELTLHPGAANQKKAKASAVLGPEPTYASGVSAPTSENPAIQYYCQKNFVLALTDGLPTMDVDIDDKRYFDLEDYDGDCSAAGSNCGAFDKKPGQSYDSNDGSDYLDDVAAALYDIDLRPDLDDDDNEEVKNNITSYFIGFADSNLADNQLLKDAGSQGGGSYKYASNASELVTSFNEAIDAISSSVGTQSSVSFNSTSLDTGSVIYSAKFDTSDYSGRLYARYLDPETGRISTTAWEASEKLANESSSSREIITYLDGTGVAFTVSDLDDVKQNGGVTPHRADLRVNASTGLTDDQWDDRLAYIRGDTSKDSLDGFRPRGEFSTGSAIGSEKLLGDIVHSTPVYVGKPELNWPDTFGGNSANDSYAQFVIDEENRTPMVYVGANDGMLHGFNADTGEEVFGYVPALVLNDERYKGLHAFTSSTYSHNYYVDLTPSVSDVYIDPDGGNKGDWRTILVGGLRGGGKGYFALDITDPGALNESNAEDIVLWEFDGGDDTDRANLGYGYSEAQIAKLNNDKWAVIFGNGYNSENGEAGLFVVYIEDGIDGWSSGEWKFISTNEGALANGRKNGLSSPRLIDLDGDRVVDRVYAGDLMGNMWAFDLRSDNDSNWGVAGGAPLFKATGTPKPSDAVMAAPLVARNTDVSNGAYPNVLVMFGTGQYLNTGDLTDPDAGGFYAVWDNGETGLTAADLAERTMTDDGRGRKIQSGADVDWTQDHGWKLTLDNGSGPYAGERVISAATLRRNTLFFSTVYPNPQPCASSGKGYLMSLDFRTGKANEDAVVDINNDGEINAQDEGYVGKEFDSCTGDNCDNDDGNGGGGDPGMPGQSGFIGDIRCTPGSNGDVICDDIDVGDEEREGRLSWEEFSPR